MRSAKYYVDFIEGNSYINIIFAAEKNLRRLPRLLTYLKGIGSVYKRHPVTKFEHGNHGASKRTFNHMTIY